MPPGPPQPKPDPIIAQPAIAARHGMNSRVWLAALVLALATVAAYHRTFSAPFVFDDTSSIAQNASIRHIGAALAPPNTAGETVSGRPLVNLSLALNYAISGARVWSYHAMNLLIHLCAGLALFGLMRRTLLLPSLRSGMGGLPMSDTGCQPVSEKHGLAAHATPLAAAIAALWLLHPLQTESVTYIVQRAESLMALFYLLTLYCFVRNAECGFRNAELNTSAVHDVPLASDHSAFRNPKSAFLILSVLCCLLGMAAKEVMISAPLIVLLYDRALVSGSFRAAWKQRRVYYICLAATWIFAAAILSPVIANGRGHTAGFGSEISAWPYLLTQMKAIPHYLRLAIWPSGLTFDYGMGVVSGLGAVWPQALLVLALFAAVVWANIRHPKIGLPGAFFFAVLAPSSSIVPVATQTMAEHRMYLPLAAVAVAVVLGGHAMITRKKFKGQKGLKGHSLPEPLRPLGLFRPLHLKNAIFAGAVAAAALLLALTISRNEIYRDKTGLALWRDTVARAPDNPRAQSNLAAAYVASGKNFDLALRHARAAVRLKPDYYQAYNNLGFAYYKLGSYDDALANLNMALQSKAPGVEIAYNNRGTVLYKMGRFAESLADFQQAVALKPLYTEAYSNMGNALFALRRGDEAMRSLDTALGQDPDYAAAWNNKGNIYAGLGTDMDEALRCYKHAARLDPEKWDYADNVARLLLQLGRASESVPYWQAALPLASDGYKAHYGLGNALMLSGRVHESIPEYEAAIANNPRMSGAQINLAVALTQTGRAAGALPYFETALRISPNYAPIHQGYATALAALGRVDEAIGHCEEALRLDPNFTPAREQLLRLQREKAGATAAMPAPAQPAGTVSSN